MYIVLVGLIDAGFLYEYFMESVPVGLIDAGFLFNYFGESCSTSRSY